MCVCVCVCVRGQAARGGAAGGWRGKRRTLKWTASCLGCSPGSHRQVSDALLQSGKCHEVFCRPWWLRVAEQHNGVTLIRSPNGLNCPLGPRKRQQAELEGSGGRGLILRLSPGDAKPENLGRGVLGAWVPICVPLLTSPFPPLQSEGLRSPSSRTG